MEKYNHTEFGCCPRISCEGQQVLPIGISDTPGHSGTTIFCPMCHEVYVPKSAKQGAVDGAFFGTTFAHLFLLVYPQFIPKWYALYIVFCFPLLFLQFQNVFIVQH